MIRSVWAYRDRPIEFSIINTYMISMFMGLRESKSYEEVMRND